MDTIHNRICFNTEGSPDKWESTCLPIGNGYMGATFSGGIERETVVLNEKTLWTGGPSPGRPGYDGGNRRDAYSYVKRVQELLAEGKRKEAEELLPYLTCETDQGFGAYQLLCDAVFEFPGIESGKVKNYSRTLDLDRSLYTCRFLYNGDTYTREAFASYPDRVICMRFRCDERSRINVKLSLEGLPKGCRVGVNGDVLVFGGKLEDNGLAYSGAFVIMDSCGKRTVGRDSVTIEDADSVTVFFTAATDYSDNYPVYRSGMDPSATVRNILGKCEEYDFRSLYERHFADYSSLFGRVRLELNGAHGDIPDIETLLKKYREDCDEETLSQLETLYFQYGRYLLISSSREGSLPANLQGVWNESNTPPWCCDYHINVNLQMNYWHAFTTNLAETAGPLVRYLDSLRAPGRVTAREYYNICSDIEHPENGWIAHTQSNPFGWTSPGWDFYWGWSTAAVAWLMLNISDHYDFTNDEDFLRTRIYPIMREAAEFYTQWLIWDEKQGRLVSSPTYSPEHGPVTVGNTYEQSLILEFYERFIRLAAIVGDSDDDELRWKAEMQAKQLRPFAVGKTGLLKEWYDEDEPDFDRSRIQKNHRHISHLMSLYPGSALCDHRLPELMSAAIATMNDRGDESTGWARAYKLCLWSRTGDGKRAYKLLRGLLTDCTYPNLWDFHPPFQIDGNFGGSAGIAEMLLQSHEFDPDERKYIIDLLPAIPEEWSEGSFSGLCARGGFEISSTWKDHRPTEICVKSLKGGPACVRTELHSLHDEDGNNIFHRCENGIMMFETEPGKKYLIC